MANLARAGMLAVALVATCSTGMLVGQGLRVSHLAGPLGGAGSADGTGTAAAFNGPQGVAVDASGSVYVADTDNYTIRRIAPDGTVTTLAGLPRAIGDADGTGSGARFYIPTGVAVGDGGTVYVVASGSHTIKAVTPAGVVTTLAGLAGTPGSADGTGTEARFRFPIAAAVDAGGNLIVSDTGNHTIRRVSPAGVTTTVAGLAGIAGSANGTGTFARFNGPRGVAVDGSGTIFVADYGNHTLRQVTAAGVVTTVAGLAGSPGVVDGVGTDARFNGPSGVAVGSGGVVYVSDRLGHTVRAVDASRQVTTLAGLAGAQGSADGTGTEARFRFPYALAADAAGALVVADRSNNTIRRVSAGGATTTLAGLAGAAGTADGTGAEARFSSPRGVAGSSAGAAIVADTYNHTIRAVSSDRVVSTVAGAAGVAGIQDGSGSAALFNAPFGVAVGPTGMIYVADYSGHVIRSISTAGAVVTIAGDAGHPGSTDGAGSVARFNGPRALAVTASGTVYVADSDNHVIRAISPEGVVSTVAGTAGASGSSDGTGGAARFYYPSGLALDRDGRLIVADTFNHTIRRITPDRVVTTMAGEAGLAGSDDGTGTGARFNLPRGVAVDGAGVIWVADSENHTVRRISTTGVVSTASGTPSVAGHVDGVGPVAQFSSPTGLTAPPGRVLVTDAGSNAIRALTRYAVADFDGDLRRDVAVYRPSTGTWFSLDSSTDRASYQARGWGVEAQGDRPVVGDFDGDGVIDPTVFRPSAGTWFVLKSSSGFADWTFWGWGESDDTPVAGDYDGDGVTDAAVYRPASGTWYVRPSSGAAAWNVVFGQAGDRPVPGDYDGDGRVDITVYRPSTGTWFVLTSASEYTSWWFRGWGLDAAGDVPAPGDFDGDGRTDVCVFRPASGTWFVLQSSTGFAGWTWLGWGTTGDVPVPDDYDGDGITDAAVYRETTGTWYVRPSSGAVQWQVVFGAAGDSPIIGTR